MLEIEKNFTWSRCNLVIALVPLDTQSLATSKYKSRHMALWITLNVMVQHFVMVKQALMCQARHLTPSIYMLTLTNKFLMPKSLDKMPVSRRTYLNIL